jgi:hypothetical protein
LFGCSAYAGGVKDFIFTQTERYLRLKISAKELYLHAF